MVDDEALLFAVRQKGNLPIIHYNWLLPWPYKWTLRDLEQPEEFQFDHHPLAPHHPNRPWPRVFPPDPTTIVTTSPSKQQQKFGKQWAVLPVPLLPPTPATFPRPLWLAPTADCKTAELWRSWDRQLWLDIPEQGEPAAAFIQLLLDTRTDDISARTSSHGHDFLLLVMAFCPASS